MENYKKAYKSIRNSLMILLIISMVVTTFNYLGLGGADSRAYAKEVGTEGRFKALYVQPEESGQLDSQISIFEPDTSKSVDVKDEVPLPIIAETTRCKTISWDMQLGPDQVNKVLMCETVFRATWHERESLVIYISVENYNKLSPIEKSFILLENNNDLTKKYYIKNPNGDNSGRIQLAKNGELNAGKNLFYHTVELYKYNPIAAVNDEAGKARFAEMIKRRLIEAGISREIIDVDVMTTAEFNCLKKADIWNYDYIRIGANAKYNHVVDSGSLLDRTKGFFKEGDTYILQSIFESPDNIALRKYKYTVNSKILGELDFSKLSTSSHEKFFSGNDITRVWQDELLKYIDAGYPLDFDSLCEDSSIIGTQNEDESKTNMAELYASAKAIYGISSDAVNKIKAEVNKRIQANRDGAQIKIKFATNGYPANKYANTSVSADSSIYGMSYANNSDSKVKKLTYDFSIEDTKGSGPYSLAFYADFNYDGIFDSKTEIIDTIAVYKKGASSKTTIELDSLQKGVNYQLVVNATDFVGCFSWKIQISEKNGARFAESTGNCRLQNTSGLKQNVRILQLTPTTCTINLPKTSEMAAVAEKIKNGDNSWKNNTTEKFAKYLIDQTDFNITLNRFNVNDLATKAGADNADTIYQYLHNNYDMIVFGFGSKYDDINSQAVCDAVKKFIEFDGRAVLFTNDTTSPFNYSNSDTTFQAWVQGLFSEKKYWGYNINKNFRDILGMNRYGTGSDFNNISSLPAVTVGTKVYDYNYKKYPIKVLAIINLGDYFDKTGLTYGCLAINSIGNMINDVREGSTVGKINDGPITKYPYDLSGKTIDVSDSHTQYYQLDLEDPNVVVWYTLNTKKQVYQRDGRNDYFIYNRNNVTYTGVGDKAIASGKDDEIKLFVNTLMLAYRAASAEVEVKVTNDDASRSKLVNDTRNESFSIYSVPVQYAKNENGTAAGDGVVTGKIGTNTQQYKRVLFEVVDRSINNDAPMKVEFFDATTGVGVTDNPQKSVSGALKYVIYDENGKKVANDAVKANTKYYMYVPISYDSTSPDKIKAQLIKTYDKNNITGESVYYSYININKQVMQNMG